MANATNTHPLPDILRAFGQGLLEPASATEVAAHLTTCSSCCEILERDSDNEFVDRLRSARQQCGPKHGDTVTFTGARTAEYSNGAAPRGWDNHPGFRIERMIDAGGMGEVYEAVQLGLNRRVALKMVAGEQRPTPSKLRRFLVEAESLAAVRHANIVEVYEYGEHDGRPFLALEYLSGGSLATRLADGGRMPAKDAARLVAALADGVQAAHDRDIVHRDLKPANVLYDEADNPKITDFGLAKRASGTVWTLPGTVMGTAHYMSPEMARGQSEFVGRQADVYALGVILYECLTGSRPFDDPDLRVVMRMVTDEMPKPPRRRFRELPRDIESVCMKCLEKIPAERYATATELTKDLRRFVGDVPVEARPAGPVERVTKWARRKPTLATAYALTMTVLLLVGIGSVVAVLWRSAEHDREALKDTFGKANTEREAAKAAGVREQTTSRRLQLANDQLEAVEYGRAMHVAQQELENNNVAAALAILDATPPKFRGWEWGYLYRLCHSDVKRFHITGWHTTAAFNAEGSDIFTAGSDGIVLCWDVKNGKKTPTPIYKGRHGRLHAFALSPNEALLAVTDGNAVHLVDVKSGSVRHSLSGHTDIVWSIAFSRDGKQIVTSSSDKSAKIWDVRTRTCLHDLKGHTDRVVAAMFSPDGERIITGSWDKTAKIWETKSGRELHTLKGHRDEIHSIGISSDGLRVATGGKDGMVRVWDIQSGNAVLAFKAHATAVSSVAFNPVLGGMGQLVTSGSQDNTARLWDATSGAELAIFRGHLGAVAAAAFSPHGAQIVTASHDGTARIWNTKQRGESLTLPGDGVPIRYVGFTADGAHAVTGAADKPRQRKTGNGAPTIATNERLRTVAAAFDKQRYGPVGGAWEGLVSTWDVGTGKKSRTIVESGDATGVMAAWVSADTTRIVAHGGWAPRLLNGSTGDVLFLTGHAGPVEAAAFSPDGTAVATGSMDKSVRVWDAKTGRFLWPIEDHPHMIQCVVFSSEGTRLLVGCFDGTVVVWDAHTKSEIVRLKGHSAAITSIAMSPDGTRIVTASEDRTAKIWDAKTGVNVLTLRGHGNIVHGVAISSDGTRIATGGEDATARIWESPWTTPPRDLVASVRPEHQPEVGIPTELMPLQGVWRCVLFAEDGAPKSAALGILASVQGRRVRFSVYGQERESSLDLSVDANSDPKEIDLFFFRKPIHAIYEMRGDFLILAAYLNKFERPERMPMGHATDKAVDVIVFYKVSAEAAQLTAKAWDVGGWDDDREAAEALSVAKELLKVERTAFATAILQGLVGGRLAKTEAGMEAARLLKTLFQ